MPAVRTSPKDVLIRVPKVEPYSNRYVPPSVRAKEAAKKAEGSASSGDAGLPASAADPASEVPGIALDDVPSPSREKDACPGLSTRLPIGPRLACQAPSFALRVVADESNYESTP